MSRLQNSLDKNHRRGGLKCPWCSSTGEFDVYRTDSTSAAGQIRRTRICRSCGRKVGTKETVDDPGLRAGKSDRET